MGCHGVGDEDDDEVLVVVMFDSYEMICVFGGG